MLETFFIGVLVALFFAEFTGFYPGGIVVPAFLAVSLGHPLRAASTLAAALSAWGCYKILSRYVLLFGRRRFVMMILLGGVFSLTAATALPSLAVVPSEARIIGWVVPGLLANHLERQKPGPTLAAFLTASVLTWFVARLLGFL